MNNPILICNCGSTDHQIVFFKDNKYPDVYMHVHLVRRSFWQRLKFGIKYILGYKSKYGAWDEFVLTHEHVEQLLDIVDHLTDENLHTISYH